MLSKIAYFGAALAASVSGEVQSNSVTTGDIYVFAYTWTPEFCYGKVNYYGCLNPESYWTNHFTVHGLWPQYSTGGYPSYCTTEPFDPNVATAIGKQVYIVCDNCFVIIFFRMGCHDHILAQRSIC